MLTLTHRKTCTMLAIALACMTIAMVIECQIYDLPSAHEHTAPIGHHQSQSAPGHTTGSVSCLLGELPTGTLFLVFTYVWLHTVPVLLSYTAPTFALFIPPRKAAR